MRRRSWKTTPKWGAVIATQPGQPCRCHTPPISTSHVAEKMVCFNEKNARLRCKQWKRNRPDHIARLVSLVPKDTTPPEVIP